MHDRSTERQCTLEATLPTVGDSGMSACVLNVVAVFRDFVAETVSKNFAVIDEQ